MTMQDNETEAAPKRAPWNMMTQLASNHPDNRIATIDGAMNFVSDRRSGDELLGDWDVAAASRRGRSLGRGNAPSSGWDEPLIRCPLQFADLGDPG
jgi:hypothetical protein